MTRETQFKEKGYLKIAAFNDAADVLSGDSVNAIGEAWNILDRSVFSPAEKDHAMTALLEHHGLIEKGDRQ